MAVELTTNGIFRLVRSSVKTMPILQVRTIDESKVQVQDRALAERFIVMLSDGGFCLTGLVAGSLNQLVHDKVIVSGSIFKLKAYRWEKHGHAMALILLDMEPLKVHSPWISWAVAVVHWDLLKHRSCELVDPSLEWQRHTREEEAAKLVHGEVSHLDGDAVQRSSDPCPEEWFHDHPFWLGFCFCDRRIKSSSPDSD